MGERTIPLTDAEALAADVERLKQERAYETEANRIRRAEELATTAATVAAELRSHERHLQTINGSIGDLARDMKESRSELMPMIGAVGELTKAVDKINENAAIDAAEARASRRSIKVTLYSIAGAVFASGLGGLIVVVFHP